MFTGAKDVSRKDPERRRVRRSRGKEAEPDYGRHAGMENRNGLLFDRKVPGTAEAAKNQSLKLCSLSQACEGRG